MIVRKPLVLALIAAGLMAADGPEAQSNIFVPELAMLDGVLCVTPGKQAGAPMMPILLAQAARTEVSPAAKAAASAAPASATADQPMIAGLGTRGFTITTKSKEAQQYFSQG